MDEPYRRPDTTTDEPAPREITLELEETSLTDRVLGRRHAVTLRVADGALEVVFASEWAPERFALASIHDVVLEEAGPGPFVGENHTHRVVLVAGVRRERVPLSKGGLPRLYASDCLARARLFLRAHGWAPESER